MRFWKVSAGFLGTMLEAIVVAPSSLEAIEIMVKSDSMWSHNTEAKEFVPKMGSIIMESSLEVW